MASKTPYLSDESPVFSSRPPFDVVKIVEERIGIVHNDEFGSRSPIDAAFELVAGDVDDNLQKADSNTKYEFVVDDFKITLDVGVKTTSD